MLQKYKIIRSMISSGPYGAFIEQIMTLASQKRGSYVCVANVHMTIEAYRDKAFQAVVDNADIATPDGMPLAKAMRLLYGIAQDRVAGMDLMPDLLREAQKKGMSVYLYGSVDDTLKKIVGIAEKEFPGIDICGYYSPPFRTLEVEEKEQIIDTINAAEPNIIFVALGCPKQEKWMAEHQKLIHSCMIGLGGAFDVYAGNAKRAPSWMQKFSLEWVYRLYQEPRRLFKRYLVTNTLFIVLFLMQYFKGFFRSGKRRF